MRARAWLPLCLGLACASSLTSAWTSASADDSRLGAVPVRIDPIEDPAEKGWVRIREARTFSAEIDPDHALLLSLKLKLTAPQIVSGSIGAIIGTQDCITGSAAFDCLNKGLLVELEPGLSGGKFSAGYESMEWFYGGKPYFGYGVKATLLYTWFNPVLANSGDLGVGAEANLTIRMLNLSLGALKRVVGNDPDHDWIFTTGVGFEWL